MKPSVMTRWTALLLTLLVLGALAIGPAAVSGSSHDAIECGYPVTLTDATETEVTVEAEPDRVVTLAPSAAQTMWHLEAEEKVVGVSMHADFLEGAGDRTNVSADPFTTDLETVVALEPDLVLAPNVTPVGEVDDLRDLGLTVVHFETATSIDDVINKTETIGELVGACSAATTTIDEMRTTLQRIDSAVPARADRPLGYYTLGDGISPGSATFQNDAIERAGLRNLASEVGLEGWSQLSQEVVVDRDPEWLLYTDSFPEPPVGEGLANVTAMREDQHIVLDANAISQPSPALVDAIETIHETVYGDLATPTDTPQTATMTATETETPTAVASPTETDDTDAIPGFGAPLAVIAGGIATIVLLRRRHG